MPQAPDEIYEDRLRSLQGGGSELLERAMARLPMLADAVAGSGPLAMRAGPFGPYWGQGEPVSTRKGIARLLASGAAIQIALLCMTRLEDQLLGLADWQGGSLDRDETISGTGASGTLLDRAANGLSDLFLTDATKGWVVLRPGVPEHVPLPGIRVREAADLYTSADLAIILGNLGVRAGTRKWERIDALEEALRDRALVESAIAALDPEADELFRRIARMGHTFLSDLEPQHRFGRDPALRRLQSAGLIGLDMGDGLAWAWLDALVALNGHLYEDWSAPEPTPVPVTGAPGINVPASVGRLGQILQRWGQSPPAALKTGGLGVRPIRATAKSLGLPSAEVGLLASLAIELGLLSPVVTAKKGRGRNASIEEEWRPTTATQGWAEEPAWRRWAALVQQWLDSSQLDLSGKEIERYETAEAILARPLTRAAFIKALAELDDGLGVEADQLSEYFTFRFQGTMSPSIVTQLVGEARCLGLVPDQGPVGLTPVARQLLEGTAALDTATRDMAHHFIVQADHTVIAPPDLSPEVAAQLEGLAGLESDAGARVFRIGADHVLRAIDSGWDAHGIVEFFRSHSTTPIPQNVERTIVDASERHGRLVVGNARTWVTSEDAAFLAEAVAVKAAKLEMVSPTLAISGLATGKVMEALRRKGLAPRERNEPKAAPDANPRAAAHNLELRDRLLRTADELSDLAGGVVEGVTESPRSAALPGQGELDDLFAQFEEEM